MPIDWMKVESKPYLDMRHSTLENKLLYLHEMTSPRPFAKARPSEARDSIHSGRSVWTGALAHRRAACCSAGARLCLRCLGFISSELRRRTTYPQLQMRPQMPRSVLLLRAA